MVELTTAWVVVTSYHFGDNYTDGLMVHATNNGVVFTPRQKVKNTTCHSINNSMGVVLIITIVKIKTMLESLGYTEKL